MGYYSGDNANMVSKGLHAPKPGLNSVGEYQVSGRPYFKTIEHASFTLQIDGATTKAADLAATTISFPFVTSRIVIDNQLDTALAVYFCSTNVQDGDTEDDRSGVRHNKNYFVIPAAAAGKITRLETRVKARKIYLASYGGDPGSGYVSVLAELTNIEEPYDCDVDNIDGISG